ncbi:tRNA dihydrouridine synthase DusB [soil metagenome]
MNSGFWTKLNKPIIGLSPMDGVTDFPMREITKKYGNPAITYTEFTSVEGVCHGAKQLLKDFLYSEHQRPAIGQIYGTTPEFFRQTTIVLCQLGYDGVDINMGCPAKNVAHSGAGAALIKTPKLAQEIIKATQQGVTDWMNGQTVRDCPDLTLEIVEEVKQRQALLPAESQIKKQIPVSVKTRVGYDAPVIEEWISNLLEMEPAAIALHGRTLKQQYSGLANWDLIAEAAVLAHKTDTLFLGNGDIESHSEALKKVKEYGLDGVLIGQASMGNPFIFSTDQKPNIKEIMNIAYEHSVLFENTFKDDPRYNFLPMRKHLGWYVRGMENAAILRQSIYQSNSASEFFEILKSHELA